MTEVEQIVGQLLDKDTPTVRRALSVIEECLSNFDANVALLEHEVVRQKEVAQARADREVAAKAEADHRRAEHRNKVRGLVERRDANRAALQGKKS